MAKLMIPYGHPADPAAFEDQYASRCMPYTVEQADGDKPTSGSPPPFGRAITGRSACRHCRKRRSSEETRIGREDGSIRLHEKVTQQLRCDVSALAEHGRLCTPVHKHVHMQRPLFGMTGHTGGGRAPAAGSLILCSCLFDGVLPLGKIPGLPPVASWEVKIGALVQILPGDGECLFSAGSVPWTGAMGRIV
jgi:hypothetical protein